MSSSEISTLPSNLSGSSRFDGALIRLIKLDSGSHRTNIQGLYQDEVGRTWYVKKMDEVSAARETFMAEYFRLLTAGKFSTETQFFSDEEGGHYVLSSFQEGLAELSKEAPLPRGLMDVLAVSYLIADGDCLPKNLKVFEGSAFRFDFGCAGNSRRLEAENKEIPFLTTVKDLKIGFPPEFLSGRFEPSDFHRAISHFASSTFGVTDRFWQRWQEVTKDLESFNLEEIRGLLSERSRSIFSHFNTRLPLPEGMLLPELVEFYRQLQEEKVRDGDLPLLDLPAEDLAAAHQKYFAENGAHPAAFTSRKSAAENRVRMTKLMSTGVSSGFDISIFGQAIISLKPNEFDLFIISNLEAMDRKITALTGHHVEEKPDVRKAELEAPSLEELRAKYKEFSTASFAFFKIFAADHSRDHAIGLLRERAAEKPEGASSRTLRHFGLE